MPYYDHMPDNELRRNGEYYPDPTAYHAIQKADRVIDPEREHHYKLIGAILRICELAGFSVEERIVLRDKRTGRIWR